MYELDILLGIFYFIFFSLVLSFIHKLFILNTLITTGIISEKQCGHKTLENEKAHFKLLQGKTTPVFNFSIAMVTLFMTFIITQTTLTLTPAHVVLILTILIVFIIIVGIMYNQCNISCDNVVGDYNYQKQIIIDNVITNLKNKYQKTNTLESDKQTTYRDTALILLHDLILKRVLYGYNYYSILESEQTIQSMTPSELFGYLILDKDSIDYQILSDWICKSDGCTALQQARKLPENTWNTIQSMLKNNDIKGLSDLFGVTAPTAS